MQSDQKKPQLVKNADLIGNIEGNGSVKKICIPTKQQLIEAGAHFGHLKRKWHPKMKPYILLNKNNRHFMNIHYTQKNIKKVLPLVENIISSGEKIMLVATKKQFRSFIAERGNQLKIPYVTERWLGGMLTNFVTIRKSLKKLNLLDKLIKSSNLQSFPKKEQHKLKRKKDKLMQVFEGILFMKRLPSALIVIDAHLEKIAVSEARKLKIPVIGIIDTNTDPTIVNYPIPGNDDTIRSIKIILEPIFEAIKIGTEKYQKQVIKHTSKSVSSTSIAAIKKDTGYGTDLFKNLSRGTSMQQEQQDSSKEITSEIKKNRILKDIKQTSKITKIEKDQFPNKQIIKTKVAASIVANKKVNSHNKLVHKPESSKKDVKATSIKKDQEVKEVELIPKVLAKPMLSVTEEKVKKKEAKIAKETVKKVKAVKEESKKETKIVKETAKKKLH